MTLDDPTYKQSVAQAFGSSACGYAAQASLQKDCAQTLMELLEIQHPALPSGRLLEIGCGTGFMTQKLIRKFPDRSLIVTDLAEEMLQFCRSHLEIPAAQKPLIQFQQQDGEAILSGSYALIVSSFVIQWFQNPVQSLLNLVDALQPSGVLLISFPTAQSFPEWRQICQTLDLPFTANPLPDSQPIAAALAQVTQQHQVLTQEIPLHFSNAAEFLRSFKAIGANFSQTGKQLSTQQMRQLIRAWDQRSLNGITVHFQVCFGVFQR